MTTTTSYIDTAEGADTLARFLTTKAKSSRPVYRSEIRRFFKWHSNGIQTVDESRLKAYKGEFPDAPRKTLQRRFSMLRGFLEFAGRQVVKTGRGELAELTDPGFSGSQHAEKLLSDFGDSLDSPHTARTYQNHLRQFFREVDKPPGKIDSAEIIAYFRAQKRRLQPGAADRMAPATLWGRWMAVKAFLRWYRIRVDLPLIDLGRISDALRLDTPDPIEPARYAFTEAELKIFLKQPDPKTLIGLRDRAAFQLMAAGALRVSEICNFRFGDLVGWQGARVKIRIRDRKGKAARRPTTSQIHGPAVVRPLKEWITGSRWKFEPDTPLFLRVPWRGNRWEIDTEHAAAKRPLRTRTIQDRFDVYLAAAGIDRGDREGLSAHSMRHTTATLLSKSMQLNDLREFLGHRSVQSTIRYLHTVVDFDNNAARRNPFSQ